MRAWVLSVAVTALFAAAAACSDDAETSAGAAAGSGAAGQGGGPGSGTMSTGGSGGSGGSADCTTVADCPDDGACGTWACEGGLCVGDFEDDGTPVPGGEVIGDCQRLLCDGQGAAVQAEDPEDVPNDYNPCTSDACIDGQATFDAVADGTPCGANDNLSCLAGVCVGCNNKSQCPQGGPCHEATCNEQQGEGTCGLTVDVGEVVGNPVPDDCYAAVCNADGNIVVAPDPGETPMQDEETCTVESCTDSGLVESTELDDGVSCAPSTFCSPYSCVSGVCTEGTAPPNGTQTPNQIPGDCHRNVCQGGVETTVVDDADPPADPTPSNCTMPACSGGSVTEVPRPSGYSCVGGISNVCNGDGLCT